MIIFDLDGTLADCEHRRHFVDPNSAELGYAQKWKPDWDSFYEACDKDIPIIPVIEMARSLHRWDYYAKQENLHIWSGRSLSVLDKTEKWLDKWGVTFIGLKMRPIGDSTPDDVLKERWLDEALAEGYTIDYVFDDRPKVVRMWRRRGIFVFNCNQTDREF